MKTTPTTRRVLGAKTVFLPTPPPGGTGGLVPSPIHLRCRAGERLLKGALRRAGALRARVQDLKAASRTGGRIPAMVICMYSKERSVVRKEEEAKEGEDQSIEWVLVNVMRISSAQIPPVTLITAAADCGLRKLPISPQSMLVSTFKPPFSFPFAAASEFACRAYRLRCSVTHDELIACCRLCCPCVETCRPRRMS